MFKHVAAFCLVIAAIVLWSIDYGDEATRVFVASGFMIAVGLAGPLLVRKKDSPVRAALDLAGWYFVALLIAGFFFRAFAAEEGFKPGELVNGLLLLLVVGVIWMQKRKLL